MQPSQEESQYQYDTGLFLNVGEKGYQEERWAMNRLAELGRIAKLERDLELGLCQEEESVCQSVCQEEEESNTFSKSVMPIPVLSRQTTGMVLCNGSMVYNGNPTGERLMLNSCIDFVIDDIDNTLDTEE
jgi:hypothetical protein